MNNENPIDILTVPEPLYLRTADAPTANDATPGEPCSQWTLDTNLDDGRSRMLLQEMADDTREMLQKYEEALRDRDALQRVVTRMVIEQEATIKPVSKPTCNHHWEGRRRCVNSNSLQEWICLNCGAERAESSQRY